MTSSIANLAPAAPSLPLEELSGDEQFKSRFHSGNCFRVAVVVQQNHIVFDGQTRDQAIVDCAASRRTSDSDSRVGLRRCGLGHVAGLKHREVGKISPQCGEMAIGPSALQDFLQDDGCERDGSF